MNPRRAPIMGIAGLGLVAFALLSHLMLRNPSDGLFAIGWYGLVHLLAGVACLVAYFSGGGASLGNFVRQRSTRYGMNAAVYSVLFVAVVAMVNLMGTRYHYRIDVSAAGVNSLSEQSRKVLDGLAGPVHIEAYLDGGRDPVLEELVGAYRYHSDLVTARFIDPQVHPELAQAALISQVPSLKLSMGEQTTVITKTDEESVTNGIVRVAATERKKIYFIEGHGEPSITDSDSAGGLGLFAKDLKNQNYAVEKLFLPELESVPADAAAVISVAADKPYFPHEVESLERYMRGGGRVMFLLEPAKGSELTEMLTRWGIVAGDNVIVDQQMRLFQGLTLGLEPVVATYGKHPSVASLTERTIFSLARSVSPLGGFEAKIVRVPLAFTSAGSWAESDHERLFAKSEASLDAADLKGPVPLAVAASAFAKDLPGGDAESTAEFEMIVFGDSTFATNKYWRQLFNDALALSGVAWLAGEEHRISIGSRAVRASRAYLTQAQVSTVFYLSVLVIPELILLAGIVVWWRRSSF